MRDGGGREGGRRERKGGREGERGRKGERGEGRREGKEKCPNETYIGQWI